MSRFAKLNLSLLMLHNKRIWLANNHTLFRCKVFGFKLHNLNIFRLWSDLFISTYICTCTFFIFIVPRALTNRTVYSHEQRPSSIMSRVPMVKSFTKFGFWIRNKVGHRQFSIWNVYIDISSTLLETFRVLLKFWRNLGH